MSVRDARVYTISYRVHVYKITRDRRIRVGVGPMEFKLKQSDYPFRLSLIHI